MAINEEEERQLELDRDYDELTARAERGELKVKPGTVLRGSDAADEAQRLLMEATGATTTEEMARIALEQPTLDAKSGMSPAEDRASS